MKRKFGMVQKIKQFIFGEKGGALAELAIMVPFLAVMLAAVAEFGRFFQNYTVLAKSTRTASRYLSNHALTSTETDRATSLVVCGKLTCGINDKPLVTGLSSSNVCIETTGSPKVLSVTVSIPRASGNCGSSATAIGGSGNAAPYVYQPIFDIGALLQNAFTLALPISPSTTMYYMID